MVGGCIAGALIISMRALIDIYDSTNSYVSQAEVYNWKDIV